MKKCNASGSAARDPHGIKQITVGPPHGIKQITMFIRENVECLDSSFTTTTTIKGTSPVTRTVISHSRLELTMYITISTCAFSVAPVRIVRDLSDKYVFSVRNVGSTGRYNPASNELS
ncbi:hypothetical protein J6590_031502 [Homalodisca vitripennis]|nr:hypothetical protein J6590_031502 [Homalodisca vitripennis]